MAIDDMHVIAYKILAYLYRCMKAGVEPDRNRYSHVALGIPESYWDSVMLELSDSGLIRGVVVTGDMSGESMIAGCAPTLTLAGAGYLQENSVMQRAKRFLQDTKSMIPGA